MSNSFDIATLSPHLFWDVDRSKLDIQRSKKLIVQRVLEYGLLSDWILINKYFGLQEISEVAMNLRSLDDKALSFISFVSKIPKEKFLCYTMKQSSPKHWNF